MGIASFSPKTQTRIGSITTPPPNPATPARVNPISVAINTAEILINSSKVIELYPQLREFFKQYN